MNILITGASKGIGRELVRQFAETKDNNIVALARNKELLDQLKQECLDKYHNQIHVHSIDFLSDSFVNDWSDILAQHNYHFDILINNAGMLINKSYCESQKEDIQKLFEINFFKPTCIIKSIIELADQNKNCHIINIGSMGGYQGSVKFPGLSMYSASKAALANLTECLAEEYKETKIRVNCLALGSVQTEMLNKAFPQYNAQLSAKDAAKYIVDFAKNGHHYFNGKIIPVSKNTP